jgi:putative SOS response-associated peptidase YedK
MCGKFTAKASWSEIVDLIYATPPREVGDSEPRPAAAGEIGPADRFERRTPQAQASGRTLTFRVMGAVPLIVFDPVADKRRVVPMRWGFPHPQDWKRPQPIHARAETIDTTRAFADAFRDGQRGIVIVETFNEAPASGAQHVIRPAGAIGIAFVWRRFEIAGQPSMFACVMVTVAANSLLSCLPTDRMPAILAPDDWAIWLGEEPASLEDVKACLKTVDDARWTMTPEERAKSARRGKPTVSDPAGLF